jgi:hypothetical protein
MPAKKRPAKKNQDLRIVEVTPGEHFKILMSDEYSYRFKALLQKINQCSIINQQDNSAALATINQDDIVS